MEMRLEATSNLLVLLVGSNPLPIYVTARYLLTGPLPAEIPRPNTLLLLYSNKTKKYAEAVSKLLAVDAAEGFVMHEASVGDSQRDFQALHTAVTQELSRLVTSLGVIPASVHLSITGGTKPMAVAGYETICAFVDEQSSAGQPSAKLRLLVSDVDPNHHRLRVYERLSPIAATRADVQLLAVLPQSGDLRQHISLTPENLAALHLLTVANCGTTAQEMSGGVHISANDFTREALQDYARRKDSAILAWQHAVHDEGLRDNTRLDQAQPLTVRQLIEDLKRQSKIKVLMTVLANADSRAALLLSRVREACQSLSPFFTSTQQDGVWFFNPEKSDLVKDFMEFIGGKWLEEYILKVTSETLETLSARTGIKVSTHMGLIIAHERRDRELDVYGVCGYSSVLLSCTTDREPGRVKLKAFEALQRARELGGDHAEIIVVSLMDDTSLVRDDLTTFDAEQHFHILGRSDVQGELDGEGCISQEIQRIMEG
jgi:hypothetical protein